jgi:exosortase
MNTQGPVLLLFAAFLVWRERRIFIECRPDPSSVLMGWLAIAIAGACYAIGRSQEFFQFEIGSQVPLLAGVILVMSGWGALRRSWFILLLTFLVIPIPGSVLIDVLLPLKELVSTIVAQVLYMSGMPIARDGVILYVGNYQLLIADACSGLNSMVALSAVSVLYLYLMGGRGLAPRVVLLLSVVPVAFIVNLIRVAALVIVTYQQGDAAGRRFHDNAGYLEIALAFALLYLVDRGVTRLWPAMQGKAVT